MTFYSFFCFFRVVQKVPQETENIITAKMMLTNKRWLHTKKQPWWQRREGRNAGDRTEKQFPLCVSS